MTIPTCYYCNKRKSEPGYVFKKILYNKLDSEYDLGITGIRKTTRYYEKEVEIDRCKICFTEHHKHNKPALKIAVVSLLLAGGITYFFAKRLFIAISIGFISAFITVILYFSYIYRKQLNELGIKDENEISDYPSIKALLRNGWQTVRP